MVADISLCDGGEGAGEKSSLLITVADMTLALGDSLERLEQALENGLESSSLLELSKVRALLGKAVLVVDADV